ncbi:putative ABC transport system permease protein [Caloramator quimbayensis]|uniref:Putative ABC transport system permease protein n=2 Tax=Caloramator quimbayensis TaxID=1147123 RepID=A0A1T4WRJ3_9CLOT|nr:putative ABC transport system permease protein [Caloramator quimbayensis]
MVMVLNKKIKRVILSQKAVYIGSIILVMLSSLLYTNFNISMKNVEKNKNLFLKITMIEDAKVITQKPLENISELENKFNVLIDERKQLDVNINSNTVLRIFEKTEKVDISYIVEGKNIESDNDILLDPNFAKANNIKIGDYIELPFGKFIVKGFFSMPDYIYPLKSDTDMMVNYNNFGIAILSKNKINEINKGINYYLIKYKSKDSYKIKDYIAENNFIIFYQDIKDNPRYSFVDAKLMGSTKMGSALPVIILLLTSLLVCIVIWRIIKTEFSQIGTLYALGYTKKEILFHYLSYGNIIALLGGVSGTILGLIFVKPLTSFFISYFNIPLIENLFDIKYIIISLLIPYIFIIPAISFVTLKALRLSPVNLMRGNNEIIKIGILEKKINITKLKFISKFRIREVTRSLPRLFVLIFGITIASMFLLLGFLYKNSIDYLLNQSMNEVYKYEYNYVLKAYEDDNNYGGEEYNLSAFKVENKIESFAVLGIKPDSKMINLTDESGKSISINSVIATRPLSNTLNIKEGDKIIITNKYSNKKYEIKIDKIAEVYTGNNIYMPLSDFNKIMNLNENSFIGIFSSNKLNIDEDKILKFETKKDFEEAFKTILNPLKASFAVISLFAFVISLVVIYIITGISIEENKNNISMFKIFGYTNNEINSLILNTATIPVIVGFLISIPLLIKSMDALFRSFSKGIDFAFPLKLEPLSIVLSFIIMIGIYELSKYLSKKKILNISLSEALKSQRE